MIDNRINSTPADFDPAAGLPDGFINFFLRLHEQFTPQQRDLVAKRAATLANAHDGTPPDHLSPSEATSRAWSIRVPDWCLDQRNQMTGPADDAELVVKMLNSGAPGVMLDLEDSMANDWTNLTRGIDNILEALAGTLGYYDDKRQRTVGIGESNTVVWIRPRGLHLSQAGVLPDRRELVSASLFDCAMIAYLIDPTVLKHPLSFYIPKSESAGEALWWRDVFEALARGRGLRRDYIKCMALVESHPMAYQMEEFIYNLRDHIIGLNLGRWDYMASLIQFNLHDPEWVLPDRNTIPHDVPFFQRLRGLMADLCHKRGIHAIGGMTALYPSRTDPELNERALKVLAQDKRNEANCLMDGAWTGHPDQNEIAVRQFPEPNQIGVRKLGVCRYPDLRPVTKDAGRTTVEGTRAAVRTVIRYRNGVLNGKGASLLDGYMEDLATDRIYRLMIAQRVRHKDVVSVLDARGDPVTHTAEFISKVFDEELDRILAETPAAGRAKYREARRISEEMIRQGRFDPV
jgi:malate synthase